MGLGERGLGRWSQTGNIHWQLAGFQFHLQMAPEIIETNDGKSLWVNPEKQDFTRSKKALFVSFDYDKLFNH